VYLKLTRDRVIERDLITALIIEDDIDWDPRVREQLEAFGRASRRLPNMITSAELVAQNDIISQGHVPQQNSDQYLVELAKHSTIPLPAVPHTQSSKPYGDDDNWDVLWLGHCGTSFPPHQNYSSHETLADRFMLLDDDTVHNTHPSHSSIYPSRTRIYHRSHATNCILAYAVTQRGARKIMYEHGIRNFDKDYGSAMSEWCDGSTKHMGERPMCLTSSPSIFSHCRLYGDSEESDSATLVSNGVKKERLVRSVRESLGEVVSDEIL
jgi:hypothetical protein